MFRKLQPRSSETTSIYYNIQERRYLCPIFPSIYHLLMGDTSSTTEQPNLRTDYRNPNAGMPRRFASLWAQSEILGWIGGGWGLVAGALPRTFEAIIKTPPSAISTLRLITLGSISTGAAIGVPASLIPTNLLIFDILRVTELLQHFDSINTGRTQYSVYNAETIVAALLAGLSGMSVQKKIDLELVRRGLPTGGLVKAVGLILGVGGLTLGSAWREMNAQPQGSPN
ncbi:hypothetical protein MIND_00935900 [Mycena indigotica]|uniref:Uncharacterized protein n=1 Tax=Mycena indigotica TaxID=2126181 RepID=A0A8H6SCR7_9AGAR|nr:uncharacterized protein MIND_00935900 [Mycena indigotica]KAF7297034.1 hypothetical protein MIND_00935900 [Mycena indigotica]